MGYVIKIEFALLYLTFVPQSQFDIAQWISLRNVNNTFGYNLLYNKKYRECCNGR